jgi:hypothetical protein
MSVGFEFDADHVRKIALEEIERHLLGKRWSPAAHARWIQTIIGNVMSQLTVDGKSRFKYAIHCMISRSSVSGYDAFSNCFWDELTDGVAVVDYENASVRFSMVIWGVLAVA